MMNSAKANGLPDRENEIQVNEFHYVNKNKVRNLSPDDFTEIFLGLGCFWGAERIFWKLPYVYVTSVGYGGGLTKNPTYHDLCSGQSGHAELVRVVYKNNSSTFEDLLKVFWENHDPTQGMRQGNDVGTQYRSCIYVKNNDLYEIARNSQITYQRNLEQNNIKEVITTEISLNKTFYYAEDYHQQYLEKNPLGYCGIQGTGVKFLD
jgi:peptide-methionine (S)-S-oxide reductase